MKVLVQWFAPLLRRLRSRQSLGTDLGFVAALLALAGTELVGLRDRAWAHSAVGLGGFYALFVMLVVGWSLTFAGLSGRLRAGSCFQARQWLSAGVGGLLFFLVVLVAFYEPLKIRFWLGDDDVHAFMPAPLWNPIYDRIMSRPLVYMGHWIARRLTPERFEGVLWLAVALCCGNGLLLFGIVRKVAPALPGVAATAALLLVVNRGDWASFLAAQQLNVYWMALFTFLLALWLLLTSYDRSSRLLLTVSCFLLVVSLLSIEGGYSLALLGPLLLGIRRIVDRRRFWVWSIAWTGAMAVCATRLLLFLLAQRGSSYQARTGQGLRDPAMLLNNLKQHLAAPLMYWQGLPPPGKYWLQGLSALVLAAVLFWLMTRRASVAPSRLSYLAGMGAGLLALLLGVAPFLTVPGMYRTHFFGAPGEAVLVAFALGQSACLLPLRWGRAFLGGVTSLLVAHGTMAALHEQKAAVQADLIYFEKTVHIFEQVHSLAPQLPSDDLIVLMLERNTLSPLGNAFHQWELGRSVLGVPIAEVNGPDPMSHFTRIGIDVTGRGNYVLDQHWTYEKIVAFRLSLDGTVSLLPQLPAALLPKENLADHYRPLDQLKPGPVTEMPYLRYPSWVDKPRDVLDAQPGLMLVDGWSGMKFADNSAFREAVDGARFAVNPMGQSRRTISLHTQPPNAASSWELQALDQSGQIVARAPVALRQTIRLGISLDPQRIQLFSLRMRPREDMQDALAGVPFLVYWSGADGDTDRGKPRPPPTDIISDGLDPGPNWSPQYHYFGEAFRCVNNDAELRPSLYFPRGATLSLKVKPGLGMGTKPCQLQLLDHVGHVVAESLISVTDSAFSSYQNVRFSLPRPLQEDDVYRLHLLNAPTVLDPSRPNLIVFSCSLEP